MAAPAPGPPRPPAPYLQERIGTRLAQLGAERPDLGPALDLQRILLGREVELVDVIAGGGLPGLSLPAGYLAAKLGRGIPALHGEPIPLPGALLSKGLREFCGHLDSGGAGQAAGNVSRALDEGTLESGSLLSACFGRNQQQVRVIASHHSLSADILWLAAELALAPFAYLLALQVLQKAVAANEKVAAALQAWDCGYCPACASWPAIVEAGDGHVLRCSFCATAWALSSYRCLYCSNDTETFVTAAPDPEHPGRRLQLCGQCGGYVKVLETAEPGVFPLLAVEDLASLDLDMAAIERNYIRPALPEITRK